jgi:nicotinamide-nucleotide amidase
VNAEIISVGDEILTGLVVNTNASMISGMLVQAGHAVRRVTAVGDDEAAISGALESALNENPLVVVTGGLGPTHDDITKTVAAHFFQSDLVYRKDLYDRIEAFFKKRGRIASPSNEVQAWVPVKAELLENENGTAPGFLFRSGGRLCFMLPGVPAEAERMMQNQVMPRLAAAGKGRVFRSRMIRTVGIPESDLYDALAGFTDCFPEVKLAFLPQTSGMNLRLVVFGDDGAACDALIEKGEETIRARAGRFIYGTDDDTLESVVGALLAKQKRTLAVAESCTGGLIANKLTNVPGSSAYFDGGVVAYSNASKMRLLGVPESILKQSGAVSTETAAAMAEGVRRGGGTDIGLSTTGIAGPSGGSDAKPVGLVYIGYSDSGRTVTEKHIFLRDRLWNKERFAMAALDLARRMLIQGVSQKS